MNNVINFVIHATITGIETSVGKIKSLTASFKGMATITQVATGWIGKLKVAISGLFGFVGTLAQIISGVAAAWQMFREKADKAAEAAKESAKKTIEAWKKAGLAVRDYQDSEDLKKQAEADIRLLDEKIARHQKVLQSMREEASFAAKVREMEARAEGNERAAKQAVLDGELARGEITDREHKLQTRRLEDDERKLRQDSILTPLQTDFDTAAQELSDAKDEAQTAWQAFDALNAQLQGEILGGARIITNDGKINTDAFDNLSKQVASIREQAAKDIRVVDENPGSSSNKERYRRRRQARANKDAAAALRPFAELARKHGMNINVSETGELYEGNDPSNLADPSTVVTNLKKQLENDYKTRKDKRDNAIEKYNKATEKKKQAETILEKNKALVKSENEVVDTKREEEDKTEAHRKREEAKKKEAEAKAKQKEEDAKDERQKTEAKRDKATAAETRHKDAAARARTEGGMHLERVLDNAEGNTAQKAGWDALQRLLKDAQDEPEILKALNDYVNGRKVKAAGKAWTKGRKQDMRLFNDAYHAAGKEDKAEVTQAVNDYARGAEETRLAERAGKRGARESSRLSDMDAADRQTRRTADRQQIDDLNAEVQKLRQEGDAIEQTQGQAAPDAAQAEQEAVSTVADVGGKVVAAWEGMGTNTQTAADLLNAVLGNTDGMLTLAAQQGAELAALRERVAAQHAALNNMQMG